MDDDKDFLMRRCIIEYFNKFKCHLTRDRGSNDKECGEGIASSLSQLNSKNLFLTMA
jgi:hypothetical protein